jgi:hypothetical protein
MASQAVVAALGDHRVAGGVLVIAEIGAVAGGIVLVGAGYVVLALKALSAERRCGDARSHEAALAVRLESMTAQRDAESKRADDEKERANALDDAIAEAAAVSVGPVDGSWGRLLQKWSAVGTKNGPGQGAVSAPPATAEPGPDELLPFPRRPG